MWVAPEKYFYINKHEGELAGEVWTIAENNRKHGNYQLTPPHNLLAYLPQFLLIPAMRRILYARDFITVERTYGDVNAFTHGTYHLGEIANVEHFYTAALLALIGGLYLSVGGSTIWDGMISPGIKMFRARGHALKGVVSDLTQLTVYDTQGAYFGCACNPATLFDPTQALLTIYDRMALEAANTGN
jgi:hypothetical protein